MNEPTGPSTALGIEAVQWLAQGGENLTVRVRGRWRRRRATWSGQPLLVIETETARERFPAMPEPPGVSGTEPGTWQLSFSVPAALPRRPGARAWLQLGSTVVPLPVPDAVERSSRPEPPAPVLADPQTLAERRVRAAELASEAAVRRAVQAEVRIEELSADLSNAERRLALAEERAASARARQRAAEQRAHAEHELREELEDLLERLESEGAAAQTQIEELDAQVQALRRGLDEAEHALAASRSARLRAERQLESMALGAMPISPDAMRRETELLTREIDQRSESGARMRAPAGSVLQRLGDERRLRDEHQLIPPGVRSDDEGTPGGVHSAVAGAEQLGEILAALRAELDAVAGLADRERRARLAAERRLGWVQAALSGLRAEFEHLRAEVAGTEPGAERETEPGPEPGPEFESGPELESGPEAGGSKLSISPEAQRLSEALARLRAQAAPRDAAPADPDWLRRALIRLAQQDRDRAATAIAELAPETQAARAARWLAAAGPGRWSRRRLRRRLRREPQLLALLEHAGGFGELRLESAQALALAAVMVAPEWTQEKTFTIACATGPALLIRDGEPPEFRPKLAEAELEPAPITTISAAPKQLAAVLSGRRPAGTVVRGPGSSLELMAQWLERAQSG